MQSGGNEAVMSRTILMLCSSPRRKGNTNTLAKWVRAGAESAGAAVTEVDLARLKYKANGCTACMKCQKTARFECAIRDEASPILKSVSKYDTLIFATPVYFWGPNAQLKLFLDRMYCQAKFRPNEVVNNLRGKTLALIATCGGNYDECMKPVKTMFRAIASFAEMPYHTLLEPLAPQDPKEWQNNAELQRRATAFGQKLARR